MKIMADTGSDPFIGRPERNAAHRQRWMTRAQVLILAFFWGPWVPATQAAEPSITPSEKRWLMSAPEPYFRACYLHDYRRNLRAALPIYEGLLKQAKGGMRADLLFRAMYCHWILGDPGASRACFGSLLKEFAESEPCKKARSWNARTLMTSRKEELYRYAFWWDTLTDRLSMPVGKRPPTTRDLAHRGVLDPGPGTWTLKRVQFAAAVRKASPEASWSNSEWKTSLAAQWRGLIPELTPLSPQARAVLEVSIGSLEKEKLGGPGRGLVQTVELPLGRRKAWQVTLDGIGLRTSGQVEVRIRVLRLANDADVGVGYADRFPIGVLQTDLVHGQSSTAKRWIEVHPEPRRKDDIYVRADFERFPASASEGTSSIRVSLEPRDPPTPLKAVVHDSGKLRELEGWPE